jgi:hypothetical protein
MVANLTDGIYQVALLKTAAQIKYEQVEQGGALAVITTNQLRKKEAQHKIDFERAINYLNDEELTHVEAIFHLLQAAVNSLHKSKFAPCNVTSVKAKFVAILKLEMDAIPESVISEHGKLYHYDGLKRLIGDINNRDSKGINTEDQIKLKRLNRRDAKQINK